MQKRTPRFERLPISVGPMCRRHRRIMAQPIAPTAARYKLPRSRHVQANAGQWLFGQARLTVVVVYPV
jgi:hypothetical protein